MKSNKQNKIKSCIPVEIFSIVRARLQMSLLILSESKPIHQLLFLLKSLENLWFSDDFRGNRS